ncbi:MAG: hypothetical protein ACLSF2_00425 [Butyricicoccus sp.]
MFLAKSIAAPESYISTNWCSWTTTGKLRIYGGLARHVARLLCPDMRFTLTADAAEAVTDADYVITTIRVGGDDTRVRDERIALDRGVLGRNHGRGSVSFAMRSVRLRLATSSQICEARGQGLLYQSGGRGFTGAA